MPSASSIHIHVQAGNRQNSLLRIKHELWRVSWADLLKQSLAYGIVGRHTDTLSLQILRAGARRRRMRSPGGRRGRHERPRQGRSELGRGRPKRSYNLS